MIDTILLLNTGSHDIHDSHLVKFWNKYTSSTGMCMYKFDHGVWDKRYIFAR